MKIFITGGTGFIGRNIKEQLSDKYNIFAPTSTELDILDEGKVKEYLKANSFDVIIHTATWNASRNSKKDLTKILENNLRMFFNLAKYSNYYGKMLYYGSGAEFDRSNWTPKMKEEYFDIYVPQDDYGLSKYIMCKYTNLAKNIYNLRLFGIFGKYEDWEIRFISNACCKAVYDLPITIKQNVFFDYMYIDDLVNITEWFIQHDAREKIYNICTGLTLDLFSLAKKVLLASKKKLEIIVRMPGLGTEYSGDNCKLLKEIGGYAFKNIDDNIFELYQWYLSNKNDIKKRVITY